MNGEPWDFTNWYPGEPTGGGETVLYLRCPGQWNDGTDSLDGSCRYAAIIEWSSDCNGDGIVDYGQILDGTFADDDGNGVPDICDFEDLNGDGIPDQDQPLTALLRASGDNWIGGVTVDRFGVIFAGNGISPGGSIYRIDGGGGLISYGPFIADPDTLAMNEDLIFDTLPPDTVMVGGEDRITALLPDGSTSVLFSGTSATSNPEDLHVGADGHLAWLSLNPNPTQRSTFVGGVVQTVDLLDNNSVRATNDAQGRIWFNTGDTIVRSAGDPASDYEDIGACEVPVAFLAGRSTSVAGGVLVLDKTMLRWIDADTGQEVLVLDLQNLPGLPGSLDDLIDRNLAAHAVNDHVVIALSSQSQFAIYDLFLPDTDCDENGIADWRQILDGTFADEDGNGVPDCCEASDCPVDADLNGDGCVNGADLSTLLGFWGVPDPVLGDLDGNGIVNGPDLAILLGNWSPCP